MCQGTKSKDKLGYISDDMNGGNHYCLLEISFTQSPADPG
jgi:hypothetical protein